PMIPSAGSWSQFLLQLIDNRCDSLCVGFSLGFPLLRTGLGFGDDLSGLRVCRGTRSWHESRKPSPLGTPNVCRRILRAARRSRPNSEDEKRIACAHEQPFATGSLDSPCPR